MAIQVTVHSLGVDTCSYSGKEKCNGMTVTVGDFKEVFLSQQAFVRLVKLQLDKGGTKPSPTPPRVAAQQNGQS